MTPCRGLLLCVALLATGLAPALHAQYPPCSAGMQVHTYHIYVQRQQMVQQQQMMQQQMQAMQMHQQAMQLHMTQQHLQMQQRSFHQQSQALTQQARSFHQNSVHLAMTNRHLSMQSRSLHSRPTSLGMTARPLHTTARSLHQEARTLHTDSRQLHTEARTLHQQSRQLHTTARALHMESRQLHTDPRQLTMQSRQLNTQARSLSTKTRWCTQEETITVVTINVNCGQCHQNQTPQGRHPSPIMVQAPRPNLPNLVAMPQAPRMPNLINQPLPPRAPNLIAMPRAPRMSLFMNVPRAPMPNLLLDPRRPMWTPEMWARPNQAWMPNLIPGTRPNLPTMLPPGPNPLVLNDPLWLDPMMMLEQPWTKPGKPRSPTRVARRDPPDFGLATERGEPTRPKLVEPVLEPAKRPGLVEAITTAAETSRPLPAAILQAPAMPDRALDDGLRRGLAGDSANNEGELADAMLSMQPLLSDADLQAPELPALPLSVLLPPLDGEPPDGADDADRDGAAPEFSPRAPLPIARAGAPAPGRTATQLGAPALPSLPPSILGPG